MILGSLQLLLLHKLIHLLVSLPHLLHLIDIINISAMLILQVDLNLILLVQVPVTIKPIKQHGLLPQNEQYFAIGESNQVWVAENRVDILVGPFFLFVTYRGFVARVEKCLVFITVDVVAAYWSELA